MNITRHNCEAIFLDYYEKNLSPVEVAEVLFFLEENPDLKEVFESYEAISLEHEKINFPDKNSLKKKYSREELEAILSSDISTINYEQFFIAKAEGILSVSQKERLNLFLLQYPELKKEAELFQQCRLSVEKISYEGKESLKKEFITKENREEYFIRAIENDLSASEQKTLSLFLAAHPEFKKEFELFARTIISAEVIPFDNKESLKKRERKPVVISLFTQRNAYYAVAAAILLLVGMFFIFRTNEPAKQILADKTHLVNTTGVKEQKENKQTPVREEEQKGDTENKIQKDQQSNDPAIERSNAAHHQSIAPVKEHLASNAPTPNKEKTNLQPVIMDDNDHLVAEKEKEAPQLFEPEVIAENKQEKKDDVTSVPGPAVASVNVSRSSEDEYQTIGSLARKKIKAALGVQNANPCEAEDELSMWDLAMAAKQRVQNLIGTKAIDVSKECDGTGEKVEYVFTAGNFEITRSTSK